jgi:hypothetical protein
MAVKKRWLARLGHQTCAATHNGGFCNGCVTKRCLHNSTSVAYSDPVSRMLYEKIKGIIYPMFFCYLLNNIGFLWKEKLESTKKFL